MTDLPDNAVDLGVMEGATGIQSFAIDPPVEMESGLWRLVAIAVGPVCSCFDGDSGPNGNIPQDPERDPYCEVHGKPEQTTGERMAEWWASYHGLNNRTEAQRDNLIRDMDAMAGGLNMALLDDDPAGWGLVEEHSRELSTKDAAIAELEAELAEAKKEGEAFVNKITLAYEKKLEANQLQPYPIRDPQVTQGE